MADERNEEEQQEANRVDIGGPTYQAPSYPKFRIYENTVDPKEFEPWLKQFLIELVEPKPPGAPFISVWWAALSYPIPALELADHELPLNKPFRLDMLAEGAALFSVHFAPNGKRVYVLFVGYDAMLVTGFYSIMRERLEFAFPITQVEAGQEQQDIPEQLAVLKPYLQVTLQLIVDGLTESQIATWVGKQPKTIQARKRQLATALGIEGDAEEEKLKRKGIELGLRPRLETLKNYYSSSRDEKNSSLIHPGKA